MQAHLRQRCAGADPRPRGFDKKGAHPTSALAGARHDDVEIRIAGTTRPPPPPRPAPPHTPPPPPPRGGRGGGGEPLAAGEPSQVPRLLVIVAKNEQRLGADREMHIVNDSAAGVGT